MSTEVPRYEITHGDITAEAVVVQTEDKTIVQPGRAVHGPLRRLVHDQPRGDAKR